MGYLFAVELGAIGVAALEGFADDWVQLSGEGGTGLRNIVM
jgi:hypothetical protein